MVEFLCVIEAIEVWQHMHLSMNYFTIMYHGASGVSVVGVSVCVGKVNRD